MFSRLLSIVVSLTVAPLVVAADMVPDVVSTETFEKAPSSEITIVDGPHGKAGQFEGNSSFVMRGDHCDLMELSFHFKAVDAETSGPEVKQWRPLVRSGEAWKLGDFQVIIRNGQLSVHLHDGGGKRVALDSPKIENNRWYKADLVLDAEQHVGTLSLDGRQVASSPLSEDIYEFDLTAPIIAKSNDVYFRGMLAGIVFRMRSLPSFERNDPRDIVQGVVLPCELYCDQPYIVVLADGTWVCTMTTGRGHEGAIGQHVVATRSTDQGKTWGPLIDIEPASNVSASWIVPLLTPYGRIYGFYTCNAEMVHLGRNDTHGWYAYRYSDDGGLTWSERHRVPIRKTACDTLEVNGKPVQMFWGICKPRIVGNNVYIAFTKLGKYFLEEGEGWIFHSDNILTEKDPEKIRWTLLPEGEHGIRHPEFGSIQEEHNLVPLDQPGSFCCVYRTTRGFPAISYSRDDCKTWSLPEPMTYATGRVIRHPRACPMIWKYAPGKYLFWCHNNGGKSFENRNPVWLSVGVERDGKIQWSQPEMALYADEPGLRMSYPDLIMVEGKYWLSETQKTVARVHELDAALIKGMTDRLSGDLDKKPGDVVKQGLVLETTNRTVPFPSALANKTAEGGLTFDFVLNVPQQGFANGTVLFGNVKEDGTGCQMKTGPEGTFEFKAYDGKRGKIEWVSDSNLLTPGNHRVTVIVEGAPRIVLAVVDGQIVDGNGRREFGWGRFRMPPVDLTGSGTITLVPEVVTLRIYDRALKVFESLTNQSSPR